MHSHNGTLYPMLGVGAFMAMFWTGVVVGHEIGVGCSALLILGLLFGCIASVGVCELQRRDREGLPAGTAQAAAGHGRPAADADVRGPGSASGRRGPLAAVTVATGAPAGSA